MSTSSTPSTRTESSFAASYFSYPVKYAVAGVLRRLSTDPLLPKKPVRRQSEPVDTVAPSPFTQSNDSQSKTGVSYTPPRITPPFTPPPLTPLSLKGGKTGLQGGPYVLSRTLAEEIRLLVPTRLELVDTWNLVYSLDQHGASLTTLYEKCDDYRGQRGGFVVVVKDGANNVFGAYLNEPPHPSNGHFYGNGECFLWRSSLLSTIPTWSLPPPPSADTTNLQRMTTLGAAAIWRGQGSSRRGSPAPSGMSTPDRIRFKAFPYSGLNDYMIFCEQGFLSVGGGDGHYGLWLDASLERGLSSPCPTFGNEALSDEGKGFDIIGVEIWYLGA